MKWILLSPTQRRELNATHKVVLTASDVAALGSGTTGTIALFPRTGTFPAGTRVQFAAINLITAFDASDASVNSLLIEVGDGGDTDRLLTQTELAVDGTEVLFKAAAGNAYAYPVADTVDALFTVAGGASPTLAEINAGEVEIYFQVSDLNDLEGTDSPAS
jgi:hypothetical protein